MLTSEEIVLNIEKIGWLLSDKKLSKFVKKIIYKSEDPEYREADEENYFEEIEEINEKLSYEKIGIVIGTDIDVDVDFLRDYMQEGYESLLKDIMERGKVPFKTMSDMKSFVHGAFPCRDFVIYTAKKNDWVEVFCDEEEGRWLSDEGVLDVEFSAEFEEDSISHGEYIGEYLSKAYFTETRFIEEDIKGSLYNTLICEIGHNPDFDKVKLRPEDLDGGYMDELNDMCENLSLLMNQNEKELFIKEVQQKINTAIDNYEYRIFENRFYSKGEIVGFKYEGIKFLKTDDISFDRAFYYKALYWEGLEEFRDIFKKEFLNSYREKLNDIIASGQVPITSMRVMADYMNKDHNNTIEFINYLVKANKWSTLNFSWEHNRFGLFFHNTKECIFVYCEEPYYITLSDWNSDIEDCYKFQAYLLNKIP